MLAAQRLAQTEGGQLQVGIGEVALLPFLQDAAVGGDGLRAVAGGVEQVGFLELEEEVLGMGGEEAAHPL